MLHQRFEVQRHLGQLYVARQGGLLPCPHPGEVLLQMVACGICGADIRVNTGNKSTSGDPARYITPGHEGIGRIVALGSNIPGLQPGDYVVILPHIHNGTEATQCTAPRIHPGCIGRSHTLHMGWDIDGCFADFVVIPATNLVRVSETHLRTTASQIPELREAIFALVEPMLCTLSAYKLIQMHLQRDLPPGQALVVGCGPIGILHALTLLERGFEVWLTDTFQKRAKLAQWCLGNRTSIFDPATQNMTFDLAMVTASSAEAIKTGESFVNNGGIVYLFAGLNTPDRTKMDNENIFFYEPVHRKACGLLTTSHTTHESKSVLYLGHSGYFEDLAPAAIAAVAANAAALDRAVTGIIPGFASPHIVSRLPGGIDWMTENGSPAILSVLKGTDLRERHCKLLVLPCAENGLYTF